MERDQYDKLIDGITKEEVEGLCHLLLLKRSVDGLNDRMWNASKHWDYEYWINDFLTSKGCH